MEFLDLIDHNDVQLNSVGKH